MIFNLPIAHFDASMKERSRENVFRLKN